MADGHFDHIAAAAARGPAAGKPSLLLQIVPDFEAIEGWLKLEDSELLFAAAAAVRGGCIVELGSFRGRSTVALCAGSVAGSKVPVYAIEPHEHFIGVKGGVFGPSDRRAFFKTMLKTRFASLVRLINASSQVVAPGWDKPVSLLFIDGDHRYEAVLADFAAWRPHLMDGAIVIFNDATGTGTATVVRDLQKEGALTHVQSVGRLAMFYFNAVDGAIDPAEFSGADYDPVWTEPDTTVPGARASLKLSESTYYSAKGNYLYRAIPKCACSTVKTALIELEGLPLDPNPTRRHSKKYNNFPGTEHLTPAQEADLFAGRTDTFKFVIVRDPYARLASAYADKITAGYARRGEFWIEKIKKSAQAQGVKLSEKITFEEFVRVVAGQPVREMDVHWRQQYHIARFDLIKFDFIGRTEQISNDFAYILERIQAPADIMHRAIKPHNVTGASLAMWSTVSAEVRAAFLRSFAIDFDTLRYPMRHSSVLFSPVNVDRPKPLPFVLPKHKNGGGAGPVRRRTEEARKRLMATAEAAAEPAEVDEDVMEDDDFGEG